MERRIRQTPGSSCSPSCNQCKEKPGWKCCPVSPALLFAEWRLKEPSDLTGQRFRQGRYKRDQSVTRGNFPLERAGHFWTGRQAVGGRGVLIGLRTLGL